MGSTAFSSRWGSRKKDHRFLILHSNNPRRRSRSLQRPAAFRKNHTENIGSISQHTRRLQRFDAFRSRRHVARGLKRFIRIGAEIWRSLRRLLQRFRIGDSDGLLFRAPKSME
jgi:hypothetical protein